MTKKTTIIVWGLMLTLLTTTTASCNFIHGVKGNGKVVKEVRKVSGFNAIEVGGAFEVYLTQGDEESLVVEADENLLPLIKTMVRSGTLVIRTEKNIRDAEELNIFITFKTLKKMDFSGAVDVESENKLSFDKLIVKGSGASELDLEMEANTLECELSGASDAEFEGRANACILECSGASELDAYDFIVKNFDVEISGAGEAKIHCTEMLTADVSGAGSLRYEGNPKVDGNTSGAGSIRQR